MLICMDCCWIFLQALLENNSLTLIIYSFTMEHTQQKLVEQVRVDLWSIRKLGVVKVQQALMSLLSINAVQQFVPMMRECLRASKREAALIQYLQVIDLLLNHPVYNSILHSCLIEFYPTIVSYLYSHGHLKETEYAKVIRKCWIKKVHPMLMADLRSVTLRKSKVDVDMLNGDAVLHIRDYYSKVLRLSNEEICYLLPELAFLPSTSYYQPNYQNLPSRSSQFHASDSYPKRQRSIAKDQNDSCSLMGSQPKKIFKPNNQNDLSVNDNVQFQRKQVPDFQIGKRIRYSSSETNASNDDPLNELEHLRKIPPATSLQSSIREQKPKQIAIVGKEEEKVRLPLATKEDSLIEIRKLRRNINLLYRFECPECGVKLEIQEQLKQHKERHVQERLAAFTQKEEKAILGKTLKEFYLVSKHKWIFLKEDETEPSCQWVSLEKAEHSEIISINCQFCGENLEQKFENDEWRLQDAVCAAVTTSDSMSPMLIPNEQIRKGCLEGKEAYEKKCYLHSSCASVLCSDQNKVENWSICLK